MASAVKRPGYFFAALFAACFFIIAAALEGHAAASSQAEWEETVAAGGKEGQVTVYGPPGIRYQNAIEAFHESFSKIKLVYVPGSGANNSQRLMAERRAGKYLADIFIGGSGTMVEVLFNGGLLDPLPPSFLLPEVKDPSLWFGGAQIYADAKGQYVLMMQGDVNGSLAAYNTKLFKPDALKSYWDILNPKWKGKIIAFDPKERGHIQNIRGLYYHPKIGGEFIRRLFSEMDVTTSRDQRLMLDWLAQGKFLLYLFATASDVEDANKKGLPVGVINAPDDESHMSGGFGHLALLQKAPHPSAAKVFINWVLSRQGQIKWQEKTDNNSLRIDIPKAALGDQASIPKANGKYLIASLPQYADVEPVLKIVDEALAKAGKK